MLHIRTIKPEFFKDEDLAELPLTARFLFIGLFCLADREGRLQDRPRLIKAEIYPYDEIDVEPLLEALAEKEFIQRYEVHSHRYIQIVNFLRHQLPARDEPQSEIPSAEGDVELYIRPPNETVRFRLYQRDNFTCVYCGLNMREKGRARCLDHVIPYAKGGSNDDKNLVTACKRCNERKGNRTPEEAGMKRPDGFGMARERAKFEHDPPVNPPINGGDGEHEHPINGGDPPPLTGSDNKGKGKGKGNGNGITTTDSAQPALPPFEPSASNQFRPKPSDFEIVWTKYPKRVGRKRAERHFFASIREEADLEKIAVALTNYMASDRVQRGFVQNGDTWFYNWRDWVDYSEPERPRNGKVVGEARAYAGKYDDVS